MPVDVNSGRSTALRASLNAGGMSLAWFAMGSVPLMEIAIKGGFDAAVIDLQHGLWDRMSTHMAIGAMGSIPVIARVAANTAPAIGEALDTGAVGILIPLVDTAAEAHAAVAAATFPPEGKRSGGGVRPLGEGFAEYYLRNGRPLVGAMIETVDGLRNASEIAQVDGVDFLFVGTGDLALSVGSFPVLDERHEAACRQVLQDCLAIGKPCGIFTTSSAAARARRSEGFKVVVAASDIDVVKDGFATAAVDLLASDGGEIAPSPAAGA